ncbi:MAG: hypothetical protein J5597_00425 [Spirochaetaceae bacterium]|nr:hypothetical protein [Spirochaetaceae bacterium]
MKKRLIILFALLCFITGFAFGYKDPYTGEDANAIYEGTSDTVNINERISYYQKNSEKAIGSELTPFGLKFSTNLSKLTKREHQLIEAALNEYNLEPKEVYSVLLTGSNRFVLVEVEINSVSKDGSYQYSWWSIGYFIR